MSVGEALPTCRKTVVTSCLKDEWTRALGVGHLSLRELYGGNTKGGL